MVTVTVNIKYQMSEEGYSSEEFQEFLESIRNGDMKREMHEDKFFNKLNISYTVEESDIIDDFFRF